MADNAAQAQKVEITKADRSLQKKAGTGSIAPEKIRSAQTNIESVAIDFVPIAGALLEKLAAAIKDAQDGVDKDAQVLKDNLTKPFMGLKADAPMFGYSLIGDLTASMLAFLEAYDTLDSDIVKIAEAHYKTVQLVVARKMTGDGGDAGAAFRKELESARMRYMNNNKKAGRGTAYN